MTQGDQYQKYVFFADGTFMQYSVNNPHYNRIGRVVFIGTFAEFDKKQSIASDKCVAKIELLTLHKEVLLTALADIIKTSPKKEVLDIINKALEKI